MQAYTETSKVFAVQFPKNLIANILFFTINMIIGIKLVPYFISTLGVAAYGLIPLATSFTGYVGIVVQSLNSAVSRYLTVDLQHEDYAAANRTFNTAIIGLSALIALMVPVVIIVAYLAPTIFQVPAGQENDVVLLFLGVFAAFLISSWSGNFTVQLFAYNRLDYQNIVSIINILVSAGLIVLFFNIYSPSLALVGLAYFIGAISASLVSIILAKRTCPHLKISFRSFNRLRLKDLYSMGGWAVVDQIASLLFLQIDLIIVNILFGAVTAGQYAVVLIWAVLLRSIANTISGVLTPMVFTYYAKGQVETLIKMMTSAIKLMGLFMALPIGLVCGFAPQILTVWAGEKFAFLAPLLVLMALHLTINLAVLPLFAINIAYNKIRLPGIVALLMGGLNVSLAIALPLIAGWGIYGVAAAGAIVLTLKNAIFTPWYATRVMDIQAFTFIKSMLPGIIMAIILIAGSMIIGHFIPITSLLSLGLIGGLLGIAYLFFVWKIGLTSFERNILASYLPESIKKLMI